MIDALMNTAIAGTAIAEKVFPGASLLVGHNRKIIFQKEYGLAEETPLVRPLTKDILFDIASLTKPICTATLFMIATQKKLCSLDTPLQKFYPTLSDKHIHLKHLLNHTSGLPDWKAYHVQLLTEHPEWMLTSNGRQWLIEKIIHECEHSRVTHSSVNNQTVYSDLGYILLGDILEKIFKKPLARIFEKEIATPLKLKNTFFNPVMNKIDSQPHRFAATEICSWRQKLLCGEVHDDNAWVMNGVAGHAGLFSNTTDIFTWLCELDKARFGESNLITKEIFNLFCSPPKDRNRQQRYFTLGFDTPSHPSSSGHNFSDNSLGHLGYTGTSFWWDLDKNFTIILLTNRVHPTRANETIREFRPKLHDLVYSTFSPSTCI